MPAVGRALRYAIRYGPLALEVARQLDRQLRPHVMAYRLAASIDGFVGRWVSDATHWIVFTSPSAPPLRAFPPLSDEELATLEQELDRTTLRHHSLLPEARVKHATDRVTRAPGHVVDRLRREQPGLDAPDEPDDPPEAPGRTDER